MNISEGITLGQAKIGLLAYVDDIALLGDDKAGEKTYKYRRESGINH